LQRQAEFSFRLVLKPYPCFFWFQLQPLGAAIPPPFPFLMPVSTKSLHILVVCAFFLLNPGTKLFRDWIDWL